MIEELMAGIIGHEIGREGADEAEERFNKAQNCINRINDLLEYAYRSYGNVELLRRAILDLLTEYSADISNSSVMRCESCEKLSTALEATLRKFNTGRCYCGGSLRPWPEDRQKEA